MIINSITLENIRSHENTKIDFDKGITVISGRTGSGKSSIFMGIAYALFGSKAIKNNNSLLRRKKNNGKVILELTKDNKKIKIIRGIKRIKDSIIVDANNLALFINGKQVPILSRTNDIDNKILEILNYPKELKKPVEFFEIINYTKQDEIRKLIELTDKEREKHIDRILQLSKYENTYENLRAIINSFDKKRIASQTKSEYLGDVEEKINEIRKKILILEEKINENKKTLEEKKEMLIRIKEKRKKLKEEFNEAIRMSNELHNLKGVYNNVLANIENLKKSIKENEKKKEELTKKIEEVGKGENLEELQIQKSRIEGKMESIKKELEKYDKELEKIKKLRGNAVCPLCEQEISSAHLTNIKTNIENKIHDNENILGDLKLSYNSYLPKIKLAQEVDKYKAEVLGLEKVISSQKEEIKNFLSKKEEIEEKIKRFQEESKNVEDKKNEIEELEKKEILLANECTSLEEKIIFNTKLRVESKEEYVKLERELKNLIEEKNKAIKLENIVKLLNKLRTDIRSISEIIRRKFLVDLKQEFAEKFEEIRKQEEEYSVDIKNNYEPVCYTRDGEEVSINNLSGGERTSVALAYRLALADIAAKIGGITKPEVIILDEPTVGFDREDVKALPKALRNIQSIPQMIIVTHVPELKEAADTIYEIYKKSGVSMLKSL